MNSRPPGRRPRRAFSLTEVIIAAGIFAFAVVSILALLPAAARQAAGSRDLHTAVRLCDAVRIAVRNRVPAESFASFTSLQLVAARDGSNLRLLDPSGSGDDAYFLVELAPYGQAPLQFAADSPLLVLAARVSWPFQVPGPGRGGSKTAAGRRGQFSFVFALRP